MKKKMCNRPPKIATWFLARLTKSENKQSIIGDAEEDYKDNHEQKGTFFAFFWIWFQVLISIPSFLKQTILWSAIMFKNNLKIMFRNLKKYKGFSFINIFGLALGIASCILILSYVNFEFSYDKFHKNTDRIYRVASTGTKATADYNNAQLAAALVPLLKNDYPEIESITRFSSEIFNMFRYEDKKFYEPNFMYADKNVFETFSFSLIEGDPATALEAPNTLVLTKEIAKKYFGDKTPIGKILKFNDELDLTVTGILKKPPGNSQLQFDILISFATFNKSSSFLANSKTFASCYTYILLKPGVDYKNFETKCADFFERHIGDHLQTNSEKLSCLIQPLTSIHLHSHLENEIPGNTNILYIYTFIIIAILILVSACINYINLSTARAAIRAKEVGMRKVLGALKGQVIRQFIGESFLFGVLALFLGIILVVTVHPIFIELSGQQLSLDFFKNPVFLIEMISILLFICLLAGGYPAFLLSGFQPIKTLKGVFTKDNKKVSFRNTLVLIQFTILIALLITTFGVFNQLNFLRNNNLGFDREQILYIKFHNDHSDNDNRMVWINSLRKELINLDGVVNAGLSSHVPGTRYYQDPFKPEGFSENSTINMELYNVGDNFLNTLGFKIIEGRGFSKNFVGDSEECVIINETAAKQIGWTNAIGRKLYRAWGPETKEFTIIGVVKDFHSRSLHYTIEPLIFIKFQDFHTLSVKIRPENLSNTISLVQTKWREFEPNHPFEYFFLDENIDNLYKTEIKMGILIQTFTLLAIFIACFGLFGMVSYISEQRTKEIGIRKIVGASIPNITTLLTKEFLLWIFLANLFAWPIAYFTINRWLQNFAYKTNIGLELFLLSGSLAALIAIFTISYRIMKTANLNPIDSLKYE